MQKPKSLFNEAFYLLNSINLESNDEDYYRIINENPDFNQNRKFTFNSTSENRNKAIDLFSQYIAINPNCKYACNYSGVAKRKNKEYQNAILDYDKALALDPNYAIALYNRGNAQMDLKNFEEAIKDFSSAISINENYTSCYVQRGWSNCNLYNFEEAIPDFTKAIEQDPNHYESYNRRGLCYRVKKEYEKAIADHTKAIELKPNLCGAYSLRGVCYLECEEFKMAIADFSKAIEINPNKEISHIKLKEAQDGLFEMEKPNKKPQIIQAISEMNVSLLEVTLDDNKYYHNNLDKKSFIAKISDVFDEFKKAKDTVLIPYSGMCDGGNCYAKGKCVGFSFVGNFSNNAINLNFEEGEDNYSNIRRCPNFIIDNKNVKPISNLEIESSDELWI